MDTSIKLKLLAGIPLNINDICVIKPLTLGQITNIGYKKYNIYLSNLVADITDFKIPDMDLSKYTYWDILMSNMYYGDDKYIDMILEAFSIFLDNKNIYYSKKESLFYINENKIIDKNIFSQIQEILKWQNCIEKKDEPKLANSKAEEIRRKILKGKQDLLKKENMEITFEDLVSVLAANGNNLNILNIWDLNMYQFNNQFNRMKMIEDYDIGIRSLLAGATGEDVKPKYYIRPIDANI